MTAQTKIGTYTQRQYKGIKLKSKEILALLSKGHILNCQSQNESII